jgi:hypothetical protein
MNLVEARRLAHQLPPVISIETAGKLIGMSRSRSYEASLRGELPCLTFGRRRMVVTSLWLQRLGLTPERDEDAPARGVLVDPLTPAAAAGDGRGS